MLLVGLRHWWVCRKVLFSRCRTSQPLGFDHSLPILCPNRDRIHVHSFRTAQSVPGCLGGVGFRMGRFGAEPNARGIASAGFAAVAGRRGAVVGRCLARGHRFSSSLDGLRSLPFGQWKAIEPWTRPGCTPRAPPQAPKLKFVSWPCLHFQVTPSGYDARRDADSTGREQEMTRNPHACA